MPPPQVKSLNEKFQHFFDTLVVDYCFSSPFAYLENFFEINAGVFSVDEFRPRWADVCVGIFSSTFTVSSFFSSDQNFVKALRRICVTQCGCKIVSERVESVSQLYGADCSRAFVSIFFFIVEKWNSWCLSFRLKSRSGEKRGLLLLESWNSREFGAPFWGRIQTFFKLLTSLAHTITNLVKMPFLAGFSLKISWFG